MKLEHLPSGGMLESQAVGMERLPRHSCPRGASVKLIGHQRMADMRHMDPDLVRAAGLQRGPYPAAGRRVLEKLERGGCGLAVLDHAHTQAVARIPADRRLDMASLGPAPGAMSQRYVLP